MKKVLLLFILILNLNAEDFRDPTHDVWKMENLEDTLKKLYGEVKFEESEKVSLSIFKESSDSFNIPVVIRANIDFKSIAILKIEKNISKLIAIYSGHQSFKKLYLRVSSMQSSIEDYMKMSIIIIVEAKNGKFYKVVRNTKFAPFSDYLNPFSFSLDPNSEHEIKIVKIKSKTYKQSSVHIKTELVNKVINEKMSKQYNLSINFITNIKAIVKGNTVFDLSISPSFKASNRTELNSPDYVELEFIFDNSELNGKELKLVVTDLQGNTISKIVKIKKLRE